MPSTNDYSMQAGDFDRPVELRHRVLGSATAGERLPSWPSAYANVWAAKRDVRGTKRFAAREVISEQVTEFQLRWRDDVLATDRLVTQDDGAVYAILQIAEVGRRQALDLLCQRLAPEAAP